jgi:hypothetical protein
MNSEYKEGDRVIGISSWYRLTGNGYSVDTASDETDGRRFEGQVIAVQQDGIIVETSNGILCVYPEEIHHHEHPQRSGRPWPKNAMECHYCGMPAYGFGFFDEPACRECGGK